ncbi:glycoside hydrolase family 2 protein [Maribacter sp. X9]|uniref:glycoside hydrolase family 2 protein n=1 Tax=Maribacter sp. X9 TaxID=3402159 RepID=UPI003AF402EC
MSKDKFYVVIIFYLLGGICYSQEKQDANTERIQTRWAKEVSAENALTEYPRPQMVRKEWKNLNGLWQYNVQQESNIPTDFDGQILVPFAIESRLSGVQKRISKNEILWYRRTLEIPSNWKNDRVLLHFGAIDWEAIVFVNGIKIGMHQGGYDPFTFDITHALNSSGPQELIVRVWDPTSDGTQARGKQVTEPNGIWYTPVSGIWQTVWMEPVPKSFIQSIRITPDIDTDKVMIAVQGDRNLSKDHTLEFNIYEGVEKVASGRGFFGKVVELKIENPKLWSPNSPFLYDIEIALSKGGKTMDKVKSYFGMRKISINKDANGHSRILLNNEVLFHYGTLDQDWWPDGLYTAPTDEALRYDIEVTKQLGFNTIRKHVKVEPARWYYHCDKIGMLVWQDMPNGDKSADWRGPSGYDGREMNRSAQSAHQYYQEWKAIIDANYNHPSIVMWVPFNEAWGQFNTVNTINWTMDYDRSRLVNGPSGGNFFPAGHTVDEHRYPGPGMPEVALHAPEIMKDRVLILGEFGGLGLPMEGHLWQNKNNWGYRTLTGREELLKSYKMLIDEFPPLIKKGLAAAIYTQTTDVEGEINGLITYDREIIKMDTEKMHVINQSLYRIGLD